MVTGKKIRSDQKANGPVSAIPSGKKHPTFEVINRVLSSRCHLTTTQRLVALAIAARMDRKGECWPSLDDIAGRIGLVKRSVQRALQVLLESELPIIGRRWDKAHRTPMYFLVRDPDAFVKAKNKKRIDRIVNNLVQKNDSALLITRKESIDQAQHARKVILQVRRERGSLTNYEREELSRLEAGAR